MTLLNSVCAIGAHPIGAPGCPDFAFCTMSAPRIRMVSMHVLSMEEVIFCFFGGLAEVDMRCVARIFLFFKDEEVKNPVVVIKVNIPGLSLKYPVPVPVPVVQY